MILSQVQFFRCVMNKLDQKKLRQFIRNEAMKLVDEDALFSKPNLGDPHYIPRKKHHHPVRHHDGMMDKELDYFCQKCEDYHEDESDCPHGEYEVDLKMLAEACGCAQAIEDEAPGMKDYSLSSMGMMGMHHQPAVHKTGHGHKKRSSYMAKPQLAKISKYAGLLLSMIDDNEELQDWQESHIAQMADDISEVFHSIEYKHHKS